MSTKKGQLKDFLKITTPVWGHRQEFDAASWDTKYDKIVQQSMKDVLQTATHSLEGTIEFCKFSGKPCLPTGFNGTFEDIDLESTDPTAAFSTVFTEHGLCYSFNQDGNLTMSRTGALYGLSLRLHVAQDDYFETQDVAGFKVLLHNSYEPPMIEEYGFALRPGSETYVRIRLQKYINPQYKDTPRPLGYCDPLLEQKFNTNYTISVCVMQYRAINMLKKCGCIAFYMDRPDIVFTFSDISGDQPYIRPRICNLKEERTCADQVLEGLALGTLRINGEKVPDPDCPSPCVYTTYTYTVSQSEYPSSAVKDKVVEEVNKQKGISPEEADETAWTIERIRDNYLKVHIYFEELSTLEMERHPSYLISNLIGDVGGQLGLLLGMNICSLVQFTDYIIRFSFFKGVMSLVRLYKAKKQREK
ncbi:acid-sensing ion channel 3-like isoform X2 [Bolinopsis microptera]|uniref:acid-sensing ion channel 3-like isoform X2 n=1 Tax=Bolinopsis microptera TaxID=2820187 RepID=UPI00307A6E39